MKKIILFTDIWDSGGIENVIMNILRNSSKKQFKFELLVSQKMSNFYDEELKRMGYKIHIINRENKLFPLKRLYRNIKGIKNYLKDKKDYILHINLSHFYGLVYARFIYASIKKECSRIIVHAHSAGIENDKIGVKKFINKVAVKIFDSKNFYHVSCSNEAAKFCFMKKNQKNYYFLPNAIDMDKFYYNSDIRKFIRDKEMWHNKKVIGHIGRFLGAKNHTFLIDIFKEVHQRDDSCILVLIGEGKLKDSIIEKVRKLNLENYVYFLGIRSDINNLYQGMDLFVLPSLFEGLPLVGIEAQAAGLNCIFSDKITKEVDYTGNVNFVSLKESSEYWAKLILKKIVNNNRENKKNKLNNSKFNIQTINKELKNIYY